MENETQNQNLNTTPPPSAQPPADINGNHKDLDTHTLIGILLLAFIYPIGLIFMWFTTKWPKWVKLLLSIPAVVAIIGMVLVLYSYSLLTKVGKLDKTPVAVQSTTPSPTPNPAADWKITDSETNPSWKKYTNTKYGYSFEIPSDWIIKPNEGVLEVLTLTSSNYDKTGQGSTISIETGKTTETSIEKMVANYPLEDLTSTYTFIDGVKAFKFGHNFDTKSSFAEYNMQFIKDGVSYDISFDSWDEKSYNANSSVYNKVLSTFKFTNENPSPSPDGKFCGGITGKACPNGYTCKLDGNYPDAGGTCVIK